MIQDILTESQFVIDAKGNIPSANQMEEIMQPNLLAAEEEKRQSESAAPVDTTPAETFSVPPTISLEPASMLKVETQKALPVAEKKSSKWNVIYIALGVLTLLIFATFAWLGYWAYILSTDLATTQQQLTALQADHEKLQADYTALTNTTDLLTKDLANAKLDLEKANTDLTATRTDLNKSRSQNNKLNAQIDKADKLSEILYAWTSANEPSDVYEIDALVEGSNNQDLVNKWRELTNSPSEETFGDFLDYLITGIRQSLK